MASNSGFVIETVPQGVPKVSDWKLVELPMPEAKDGEVVLKTLYLSVDPYLRGRLREQKAGDEMVSGTVAEVVESKHADYKNGDHVFGYLQWRRFQISTGEGLRKLDANQAPLSTALGVLGMPGMTAYFGLLDVCKEVKSGETVVVSGAAGAVGSLVGQIAKLKGCHVVGTAGTKEKCDMLVKDFKFDAAVSYKEFPDVKTMTAALKEVCPRGIDVYFDNTGGHVTDAVFDLTNKFARVSVCGQISVYNATGPVLVPAFLFKTIYKSVNIKGFVVTDYVARAAEFYKDMGEWVKEGKIAYKETVVEGFENTPSAFIGLFAGENVGKAVVKVA